MESALRTTDLPGSINSTSRDQVMSRGGRPLADVLAALGDRVAPVSMAGERTLPVTDEFAGLFAEGGLVRGRVVCCAGSAGTSVALGLVAAAVAAGSWVAVIDVPTLGLDAACELGVRLERVVAIDTGSTTGPVGGPGGGTSAERAGRWADVVAAAADGFEVMIVRVPDDVRPATVRKVATRLQQRGVVMVIVGSPGPFVCDGVLDTADETWSGIGKGWGHLRRRTVEVSATGRRLPGRRCQTMALPGASDSSHTELSHTESSRTEQSEAVGDLLDGASVPERRLSLVTGPAGESGRALAGAGPS